ncbi:hypothetical protein PIN31115_04484 [Pandoraea iniqua]|uniref:Internalin-A n=1 Tax=Pandoraea iniqua TaxID=2508288 RepID=A0A5E4YGZ6_9BURK|nr:hypothetical protein [Pandoraea iniqua]VVE47767.1 hypothetical protein PIN31115_04484 [Pandoraea iniqua]
MMKVVLRIFSCCTPTSPARKHQHLHSLRQSETVGDAQQTPNLPSALVSPSTVRRRPSSPASHSGPTHPPLPLRNKSLSDPTELTSEAGAPSTSYSNEPFAKTEVPASTLPALPTLSHLVQRQIIEHLPHRYRHQPGYELSLVCKRWRDILRTDTYDLSVTPEGLLLLERYPNVRHLQLRGWLSDEQLAQLPRDLTSLDLSACDGFSIKGLTCLLELPLQKLDLCGDRAASESGPPSCLDPFGRKGTGWGRMLAQHPTLTELSLRACEIGDDDAMALAGNPRLRALDLGHNQVSLEGVRELAANRTLQKLGLAANRVDAQGVELLAANATLTALDLGSNHVDRPGVKALMSNTTLVTLCLPDNGLDDWSASRLAQMETLLHLDVSHNQLSDTAAFYFAQNLSISELDLSGNTGIRWKGITLLCKKIRLYMLSLGELDIGDEEAKSLATCETLRDLRLMRTNITTSGLAALIKSPSIETLDLSDNTGLRGKDAEVLAQSPTLNRLILKNCWIGPSVPTLAKSHTLRHLDVRGCFLDQRASVALTQSGIPSILRSPSGL